MPLVTWNDYLSCYREYFKNNQKQRFGQYFCNRLHIVDSVLFYEPNTQTAIKYIAERYLS